MEGLGLQQWPEQKLQSATKKLHLSAESSSLCLARENEVKAKEGVERISLSRILLTPRYLLAQFKDCNPVASDRFSRARASPIEENADIVRMWTFMIEEIHTKKKTGFIYLKLTIKTYLKVSEYGKSDITLKMMVLISA